MVQSTLLLVLAIAAQGVTSDLDTAARRVLAGESYNVLWVTRASSPTCGDGWTAKHPELNMRAHFAAGTVAVKPANSNAWNWSTRLVALGRAGSMQAVQPGDFDVDRDLVEREQADVVERYLHFRAGLEQSFCVSQAPAGDRDLPLTLQLACETDLIGAIDGGRRSATFRDACGSVALTYDGLAAWDARGRELSAHMQLESNTITLTIDDRDAEYPIDIDPVIATSETKLTPSVVAANLSFGFNVEIDGDTAAVRVMSGPTGIYIFERGPSGWVEQAFIAIYTSTLALDGDWLLTSDGYSGWTGQAWLWQRVGTTWVQRPDLADPDPDYTCEPQTYGYSVALDGDRAAIGETEHFCPWQGGAVYIASWSPQTGVWRFRQRIHGLTQFGKGLALRGDDLLVSGPLGVSHYRYDSALNEFVFQSTLPGLSSTKLAIEGGVALGLAGSTSKLFELFGTTWRNTATFTSDSTVGGAAYEPSAVAGSLVAIGDPNSDLLGAEAGAIQIYSRNDGWKRMATLHASDGAAGDLLGFDVDIDAGSTPFRARLIAGASSEDGAYANSGAAYIFELEQQDALVYCTSKVNSLNCIPRIGFSGTPSASSTTPFTITGTRVINQRNGVFFYSTSGRALAAFQGALRCVANPIVRSGNLLSGGNATGTDCSGAFSFDFNAWIQSGVDPALVVGSVVDGQFWYRDGPSSFGTGLTEAIEFVVAP